MWVINCIGSIAIAATIIADIILWIYILYFKIKCRRVMECQKENCVNRPNYDKAKMTENERKHLLGLIESLEQTQI